MKIKILLLAFLVLNSLSFTSTKIFKINIIGNKNISLERILSLMKSKEGSEFNEEVFKKDIENILKTGFFKKVDYSFERKNGDIFLNIFLVENPKIERIEIEGNRVIKTRIIREKLKIGEGEILVEDKIISSIDEIKDLYRKKRYEVEVTYNIEPKDEKCVLRILINEKGISYVREIHFEGNNHISEKTLKKIIKTRERKMPFRTGKYDEVIFNQDIERIKEFYRNKGFLEVEIDKTIKYFSDGIRIELDIKEGKQYIVGKIEITGDLKFDKEELKKLILLKEGEIFSKEKNEQCIRNIFKFYSDRGYIKTGIDVIPEIVGNKINLTYFINPGNLCYAEEIKIKGNKITKDKVIRRELKIFPGDIITQDKIIKSFNNLKDTNYFEEIKIYPEFIDEDSANIIVNVKEREKTGLFLIGGGYSSIDKFVGVLNLQQTNFDITNPPRFVGGGQKISLSFEWGSTTRNYIFSFTEPYLFDRPIYIGPDIYRFKKEWDDWTQISKGFDIRFGKRWENFTVGFKLLSENIKLSEIDIPSLKNWENIERKKNSLTTFLTYSNLDSELFPTKGDKINLSLEYAGIGGDIDFLKTTLENNFYYPLKKTVFHSRTLLGYINKDINDVPIYERFFGGGIGTVRGYKERSLGPKEDIYSIGGTVILAQNFELLYPIYKDTIYGICFFDIGNVFEEWKGFEDLKKAVGLGIRVNIPLLGAPIEIYYGYALDAEKEESKTRVHIGMSFGF